MSAEDVVSYRLDYWLSQSTYSKPVLLAVFILFLVSIGGILFAIVTGEPLSGSMWTAWVLIVDSGAHGMFHYLKHKQTTSFYHLSLSYSILLILC